MAGRWRAAVRAEPVLVVMVAGFFAAYAAYAVIRHEDFVTGLDLAIFDNALWHYSRFETPVSPIKGLPNVLGDHFHPIVVVLAPLYWIWSSPAALLIAQSALLAASAVPVFLFARDRLERRPPAYGITFAYLLFWGLQSGAGFEFHELAFAPGLIACAILFADREQWVRCFVSVALLLLVKENLALLVVAFGVYLASRGELRRGLITAGAGIAWFFLATKVLIPHFADQSFAYWTYQDFGDDLPSALGQIATHPWQPFQVAFDAPQKRETIAYLLLPFLLLPLGSRIAILAIPLLAERFLSVNPQLWATDLHYSLPVAPVLAMGASAGLANVSAWLARRSPLPRDRLQAAGAGAVVLAGVLAVLAVPANLPVFGLARVHRGATPDEHALRATLDRLPPHAGVATEPRVLPHVTHRREAVPLAPQAGMPAFLLVDLLGRSFATAGPADPFNRQRVGLEITRRLSAYEPVHYERGWVLLRRGDTGNGVLAPVRGAEAARLARAAATWGAALAAYFQGLDGCGGLQARAPGEPHDCWATVGAAYRLSQAELDAELGRAAGRLRGGCRELLRDARAGARAQASDLERLRRTGRAGDLRGAERRGKQLVADAAREDPTGRVQRAVILCLPR